MKLGTLTAVVLLTTISSAGLGWRWGRGRAHGEREAAAVTSTLLELRSRQLRYFRDNHSYAPGPAPEAGPPGGAWRYDVVAARWKNRPGMLIEATDGRQAIAIDGDGRVYRSALEPFPLQE